MDISKLVFRDRISDITTQLDLFKFGLFISGMEITQAIQYYDANEHLIDPADRGTDNSVQLVVNKPAWVRVYLASILGASGINGTLEVQRRHNGFLWSTMATLNPIPPVPSSVPGLSFDDNYANTRGTLGDTLNFIIPADQMIGTLRLIARVNSGSRSAERSIVVPVTLRQTLQLVGVMISYNGPSSSAPNAPNLTLAAPILADLQAMSGTALTLFPVQSIANFRTAGTLTLTNHLQDTTFPTSGCGVGWDALHGQVANARTADGNRPGWIYYGLLPAGVPMGPVGGCGGGGVAVGPISQPGTLAHEAGHACGLKHAPAGGAPNPDTNYPAYEPYDTPGTRRASIGEFGLNINNGNVASPQTFRDFMAYGGPSWISLYHYGRLLDNERLNPVTVGIDYPWWKDLVWEEVRKWPWVPLPDPPPFDFDLELPMYPPALPPQSVISMIARIERGRVTEVMHVARTRLHTKLERTTATPFTARLRGKEGQLLAEAPLRRLATSACGCRCGSGDDSEPPIHYLAQALIPDVAPGEVLDINDGKEVVWERKAPTERVHIESFDAKLDRKDGLQIQWKSSCEAAEFWVRWSTDGEDWHALATGITSPNIYIEALQLPAGKIMLQVVAHDGFNSVTSEPVSILLPDHAPSVAILHPLSGNTYRSEQSLRLWGSVSGIEDESLDAKCSTWLLGEKTIGVGLDTWVTLPPGEHTLTLQVKGKGGSSESSVAITVICPPGKRSD